MTSHYDAIVIGSGFGGSVMAYRLAEAGLRVCVLERGKAYPPGSFARSPYQISQNFWDPSNGYYGLFNAWSFPGFDALVASGLGGGSLIYANVLLRKPEKWFIREDQFEGGYEKWPIQRSDLEEHYDSVERMLRPEQYPFAKRPYSETPKTVQLKGAARDMHMDWFLPPLGITFGNTGDEPIPGEPIREAHPNMYGQTRYTCRLCGECCLGCNYGSKNTLDLTYLSEAARLGAELRTLCEVRSFEPAARGGFSIEFVQHSLERAGMKTDTHNQAILPHESISADYLILAAGTLGSTYLLLKNRRSFPALSERLGSRFCGNGDLLTFALNCRVRDLPRRMHADRGPVITSAIREPDALDGGNGRGFLIEDAGYPVFGAWLVQVADVPGIVRALASVGARLGLQWLERNVQTDISGTLVQLLGTADLSSCLLPMIGVGRDIPNGTMRLDLSRLHIDWGVRGNESYFERIRNGMRHVAHMLGGTYLDSPTWYLGRLLTMHPLGGCPMGRNEMEGVVDADGEVFNYPGLYVADGSVMPGPVGVNPSLTIAALSNKFADHVLRSRRATYRNS